MSDPSTTLVSAFQMADRVLLHAVRGVADLINQQGFVNVDFADVRSVMQAQGDALMGIGIGSGSRRVVEAAQEAISSPLLEEAGIAGATSVLINGVAGSDVLMHEIDEASSLIAEEAHEDANVIWGWHVDESLADEARVTVIATGFSQQVSESNIERRVVGTVNSGYGMLQDQGGSTSNRNIRTGRNAPQGPSLVSGLSSDDYELPTFWGK